MKTPSVWKAVMLLTGAALAFSAPTTQGEHKFMDATKVRAVASGKTWNTKSIWVGGHSYWNWNSDGSVCMRLFAQNGKCDDTGKWKMSSDLLCFELEWFGEFLGLKSACVGVADQGQGRYLGVDERGWTLFDFTVLK